MSGHSKWSSIKRQKGAADAIKSREFARFSRLITLESKKANGDTSSPGLAAAITRAKAIRMPKDSIERAVTKGTSKDAGNLEQTLYEFYGPGGTAFIVEALTDNKNRTTAEIKHLISKAGFDLGGQGSALWAFTRLPDTSYWPNEPLMDLTETDEAPFLALLSALDEQEDVQGIYTNARGYETTAAEEDEDSGD